MCLSMLLFLCLILRGRCCCCCYYSDTEEIYMLNTKRQINANKLKIRQVLHLTHVYCYREIFCGPEKDR